MSGLRPVWIHSSLRAESQRDKRRASLLNGEMDHGFHYQGAKQAELWLEVHRRHAPLFADAAFAQTFQNIFAEIAADLAGQSVHVIGLGPGGGQKEANLLGELKSKGCKLRYTPVDASLELALLSAESALPYVETEILPVIGDLSLLESFPEWLKRYPVDEKRLYTFFGTVHNFKPRQIFPMLRDVLIWPDKLLLSTNLVPMNIGDDSVDGYFSACEDVLSQYNNEETMKWLRQVLVDWGIISALSDLDASVQAIDGIFGIVVSTSWLNDANFFWGGQDFQVKSGDRLRLFFSLRYTINRFEKILNQNELISKQRQITPCGYEGVWCISRAIA